MLRARLLRKVDDPHSPSGSTELAQFLQLDPRICQFLLGSSQIDTRIANSAQLHRPAGESEEVPVDPAITAGLRALVEHRLGPDSVDKRKLILHLHGPEGVGKREIVFHICRQLDSALLAVNVDTLLAGGSVAESLLQLAFREVLLQQAVIYLGGVDTLQQESTRPLLNALASNILEYGCLVCLGGERPWSLHQAFPGCFFHSTALPVPDVPVRAVVWERCLVGRSSEAPAWAAQLAAKFRLTPGQIRAAVEGAVSCCLEEVEPRAMTPADLAAACRRQSNHKLRELAVKVEPHYRWDDLVLPEENLAHLREICSQIQHQHRVFSTWGFGKKLNRSKGLSVLFAGPSGTGKTMAAEVLAHDVELDLYKVDLSGVVSKYIGETEKNLASIFAEAETSNAILFFDEADALFGKRTEVSDAHDRYANIETSYLLQKMEAYEGVVVLATNLRENMDEAFTRRIRFIVEFPFPDEANRLRIWRGHFPADAPTSRDIDYSYLARELQIQGGSIKNIVLNAAFLAARDDTTIAMTHIMHGAQREFEKIGKFWHDRTHIQ